VVKSQQCLKLRIIELRFYVFLKAASKKRKKSFFLFSKKRKKRILELCLQGQKVVGAMPSSRPHRNFVMPFF